MGQVNVTPRALEQIKVMLAKRATPPRGLRIGIKGGGCTGFGYLFEWSDEDARPTDVVFEHDEGRVRIFCDPKSLVYLDGTTLDFVSGLMGHGFKFVNPNVKGTCGCGESVQF